jgi:hypothetical protein
VRADTTAGELHQTPYDEEAEAGTVVAAATAGVQACEFIEQSNSVRGPEADAAIPYRQFDLARRTSCDERDGAPADRSDRGDGVLEQVPYNDIQGQGIREHV